MKQHFLGICLLVTLPAEMLGESELCTQVTEVELQGSRALHSRLGYTNLVEKQYAIITFKKKTNDDALLTTLGLQWHGPAFPTTLSASLFKLDGNGFFLPTEDYLVGETHLNDAQEVRFRFNKPIELMGSTSFALVLVVSPEIETILSEGNFSFIRDLLPEPFRLVSREVIAFTSKSAEHLKQS